MSQPNEIKAEYMSSLADLKFNSKPLINVLTMLAEENLTNADVIVEAIETHLAKVSPEVKLPVLYLVDCIVKNVGRNYTTLFSKNIVSTFCGVFGVVDEKTRGEMFKLRQTWNDVFPQMKLYAIDVQIAHLDPAWPVTAKPPPNSIHFNPKFLKTNSVTKSDMMPRIMAPSDDISEETKRMQSELLQKQRELLELQQRKLELEMLQTKVKLQEQYKNNPQIALPIPPQNILLKPEVAKQLVPGLKSKQAAVVKAPSVQVQARATSKPIRDPRLLRQQQQQQQKSNETGGASSSESKLGQKTANLDNNKIVTNNKASGRKQPRSDPRLNVNKDDKIIIPKSDPIKPKPTTTTTTTNQQQSDITNIKKLSRGTDNVSKSSSSGRRSSPGRSKKRDKDKDVKRGGRDKEVVNITSSSSSSSTSDGKGNKIKGRNYMRRNLAPSPETVSSSTLSQDEDLRGFVAPPPQKQPRLQNSSNDDKNDVNSTTKGKDVDLRQLPAVINRKRLSSDSPEVGNSKKSKSEVIDRLFGSQDTDLRQLPPPLSESGNKSPSKTLERKKSPVNNKEMIEDRPPTPPPPIISSSPTESSKRDTSKQNLDLVRAKLANATKKALSKSDNKSSSSHKIYISPEDESKIVSGELTQEQSSDLLQKIMMQFEISQLNEAKKKEENDADDDYDVSDRNVQFKDKDERIINRDYFPTSSFNNREYPRYPNSRVNWRGNRRGRGGWDNGPRNVRGWGGGNWRNVPPNHDDDMPPALDTSNDAKLNLLTQNEIKTIPIDGVQKEIRFYDETAVVFLNWDDPREISFRENKGRIVYINDTKHFLTFNDTYKEVMINNNLHRIKFGAPSKEIFVDNIGYECYFGTAGVNVDLNGMKVNLRIEGPPPQVKIGDVKRVDLVAGKINLFVDAKVIIPLFLDGKQQKFIVDNKVCTIKFVNSLKTVLINDDCYRVEYGGLPKPILINQKKHFIRFSPLPQGIRPGRVKIKDMETYDNPEDNPVYPDENNSRDGTEMFDAAEPVLPVNVVKNRNVDSPERNSNSPGAFQGTSDIPMLNNLDLLSNVITPTLGQTPTTPGYKLDQPQSNAPSTSILPSTLNINELFQNLVKSGVITSGIQPEEEAPKSNKNDVVHNSIKTVIKPILFDKPETLKARQQGVFDRLYSGIQCSSCGMRFNPEASMQYSQHLDWHFRQNRRGKRNSRIASSRKWFYSLSDWKNYEELEDIEEREKNYFDQQQQSETGNDENDEEVELPSVPADPDSTDECCEVCRDKFDQFFNEEKEEWHLRNATRVEDKTYHPVCYEDYQKSRENFEKFLTCTEKSIEQLRVESGTMSLMEQTLEEPKLDPETDAMAQQSEELKKDEQIPGLEIIIDDEDDENDNKTSTEHGDVLSLESEESKEPEKQQEQEEEQQETAQEPEEDDDVILNEIAPIKIVVDDDGDDDFVNHRTHDDDDVKRVKKEQHLDDGFVEVSGLVSLQNGGQIKIKAEPVDPDDLPHDHPISEDEEPVLQVDAASEDSYQTRAELVPSIDGNIELVSQTPAVTSTSSTNRIKINISKPLPVIQNKEKESAADGGCFPSDTYIDPSEPLPPGEEPQNVVLAPPALKPALRGVNLKKLPPVKKGAELTGLCSIM